MTSYPPPPARPQKHRPRAVWFFVGGGLLLLAGASFVAGLLLALLPLTDEDATFPADGQPHEVSVPAGEERGVYADDPAVSCSATDVDGNAIAIDGPGGEFTYNEWELIGRFDGGDGTVVFTCTTGTDTFESVPQADARIGGVPSVGGFVGGILLALVGPLVLGVAGLAVLIITIILFVTRPARPRGTAQA